MVSAPLTLGSSTTFRPLISWIRRKKSFRSTSFRFTEIGSPVYLGVLIGVTMWLSPLPSAARFTAGWMGAVVGACAAWGCMAALGVGNRLPSGLSTNFAAAPDARSAGAVSSAAALSAALFCWYVGSTKAKLVA